MGHGVQQYEYKYALRKRYLIDADTGHECHWYTGSGSWWKQFQRLCVGLKIPLNLFV